MRRRSRCPCKEGKALTDYLTYTTVDGDTYDMIALDMYYDEFKAPVIADANPEHAGTVVFPAGVVLRVPVIPAADVSTLPPWKRG